LLIVVPVPVSVTAPSGVVPPALDASVTVVPALTVKLKSPSTVPSKSTAPVVVKVVLAMSCVAPLTVRLVRGVVPPTLPPKLV